MQRRSAAGRWGLYVLALSLSALPPHLRAQNLLISEFMAANASGLTDADGDVQDWIEIFNAGTTSASLAGWHLTDDPQDPTRWTFPAVALPAQGFLVVFTSGKDRTNATTELHTNFKLDRDGEYLALIRPDGRTAATEFQPKYPQQFADTAYGTAMATVVTPLVDTAAEARLRIPTDDRLGRTWTQPDFDDGAWATVRLPLGYDRPAAGSPEGEEPQPEPVDVTQPLDFIVPTSANSPGNEGVANAIDNNTATKYLNFDKLNAGLTVTPSSPQTVVTGLRFTSANDAPERDPTSFVLSGSMEGQTFVEIARGPIPNFTGRFVPVTVDFTNATPWRHYRLIFPTVRSAASAVAVQIAEVELLGWIDGPPAAFETLVATDLETSLYGRSASAYVRLPFEIGTVPDAGQLLLRLRYDDGFVAYLNGTEVARANAPSTPSFDSTAVTNRLRRAATAETLLNLSDRLLLLRSGRNVLALHGLNSRADSRDFLLDARLEHRRISLGSPGYLLSATPGAINGPAQPGYVEDPVASADRGFYDAPFQVTLTCPTAGSTIRYTTNGSLPSATNGLTYAGPIVIGRTTPLRATAVREGWRSSRTITHTYLFLADVASQSRTTALTAGFPASWNGQSADYAMDQRVVGPNGTDRYGGKYAKTLASDLRSLPIVSLVMPINDLFGPQGIYANPESRGSAWERATSVEWIPADGTAGFQANAGLRIQGGAFRMFALSAKKSFRIVFRESYGPAELHFPLFGPAATDRFDNLVLRANSNDAWPWGDTRAVYIRDAFAMETARALGIPASHSRFAHLFINGLYWGLYNPVERPDAAFAAAYIGGDKDTWDSINQDSAPDGDYAAWNRLMTALGQDLSKTENYQRIQGNNPDGTRNPAYENLVDVDNLIDYIILNLYVGNTDWPGRNWWAGRQRGGDAGFQFRPWDTETALDFNSVSLDITGVDGAVARPYAALRRNADFRLRFADHVYRHFFHGGALYVDPARPAWDPANPTRNRPAARFAALADEVRAGIVGESARWGDQLNTTLRLRDEHWQKERDSLLTNYFPRRSALVLEQFRQAGLYPRVEPPAMNQQGGVVTPDFRLTLTSTSGIVYYTTNGADPRRVVGTPQALVYSTPLALRDLTTIRTRTLNGTNWSALNEAAFVVGAPTIALDEIHYHPGPVTAEERAAGISNADDFEFLELVNYGTADVDLNGIRFAAGIQFDFSGSAVTNLASGSRVLVVKDRRAFEARYGPGHPIAGEYQGRLDNAGERLLLVDARGWTLADLTYGTTAPWPLAADGEGASLELLDPTQPLDSPDNWRASTADGGTPGGANSVDALALVADSPAPGYLRLQFLARAGLGYRVYRREQLDSGNWQLVETGPAQSRSGPVLVIFDVGTAAPAAFYRVSVP